MNEVTAIASAPGKILWLGGYSVLERPCVSFVTGVNKRVYAKAVSSKQLVLASKQFDFAIPGEFHSDGTLKLADDNPKAKFLKASAQSTLAYLHFKNIPLRAFTLETWSDDAFGVEVKAGLGSSAAVCVASVAAIMMLHGFALERTTPLIHRIAQYAHYLAQGKIGSGFDVAAATIGSGEYVRYSPSIILDHPFPKNITMEWDYELEHVHWPEHFHIALASLNQSASTTELVKKVSAWKAAHPEEYKKFMERYDAENRKAIGAIKELHENYSPAHLSNFDQHFMVSREMKKELGKHSGAEIESDSHTALILESLKHGAFVALLPGAGGGDSIAAICHSKDEKTKLERFWKSKGLNVLDIDVSSEGVREEKTFPGDSESVQSSPSTPATPSVQQ